MTRTPLKTASLKNDNFVNLVQKETGTSSSYTQAVHGRIVEGARSLITNSAGEPVVLPPLLGRVVQYILAPSAPLRAQLLRDVYEKAGYKLTSQAEDLLNFLANPAQFATYLAETNNPLTGMPFIAKQPKRPAKKKQFATIFAHLGALRVTSETDTQRVASQPGGPSDPEEAE